MVNITTLSGIYKEELKSDFFEDIPYFNRATLSTILKREGEALNYWVKTLVSRGDIIPLKRGLFVSRNYLLKIKGQPLLFDKYREYLAGLLRAPSYISLEYALSKYGIIPDVPFAITSITNKSSRTFANDFGTFVFRNVKEQLFCGYKEDLFEDKIYYIATPAKALFDLIYLRKFSATAFDKEIEDGLRINWDEFTKNDFEELKNYTERSDKRKMERFLEVIVKGKLI